MDRSFFGSGDFVVLRRGFVVGKYGFFSSMRGTFDYDFSSARDNGKEEDVLFGGVGTLTFEVGYEIILSSEKIVLFSRYND